MICVHASVCSIRTWPLAADTPVFPGGAVVFSLALSLAELFEKAMEGERERDMCIHAHDMGKEIVQASLEAQQYRNYKDP